MNTLFYICYIPINYFPAGLGGGFLLTYYNKKEDKAYSLNAREVAPAAATTEMFRGNSTLSILGNFTLYKNLASSTRTMGK